MDDMFPDVFAASDPERPAYIMAGSGITVSYGELARESKAISRLLWSRGLRHGDTIALYMENHPALLKVAWAAQRTGLRYVALSSRLTAHEVAYILGDSDTRALFTTDALAETAAAALELPEAPALDNRFVAGTPVHGFADMTAEADNTPTDVEPDEREGIDFLYSSGTTGKPKGVMTPLPLNELGVPPGFYAIFYALWNITADTVYLSPAPLFHAAPLRINMAVHRVGGTCIIMEKFEPAAALELIERHRVTHTQMVPAMFARLLKLPDEVRTTYDVSSLTCVIHAAAPCPVEIKRAMIDWLGPVVYEYYSATEAYLFTALDSNEWLAHPGSVGRPLVGTPHILDPLGEEVAVGESGQIWSESPAQFEYRNAPEKTAESYNDAGWSTVGDIGYVDEDGYLYISDRRADMIIRGGVNVYPRESEDALIAHPKVADAAVFGIPDADLGETVHAVVVPAEGNTAGPGLADELLTHLHERLAKYKCPAAIEFATKLPRHATGKLYKRLLKDAYRQEA